MKGSELGPLEAASLDLGEGKKGDSTAQRSPRFQIHTPSGTPRKRRDISSTRLGPGFSFLAEEALNLKSPNAHPPLLHRC